MEKSPLSLLRERFSLNLRLARRLSGLNQAELAALSGICLGTLAQIEQGKGNPRLEVLSKLGVTFGLDPSAWLLDHAEFVGMVSPRLRLVASAKE